MLIDALPDMKEGLLVDEVDLHGIAAQLGIEPGDRILSVDGQKIKDILDFQYGISEECYTLVVAKTTLNELWELEIERGSDEYLGVSFANVAWDGLKQCRNNCVFCFVRQMPQGLRPSLYDFDDDYRLSVSRGNYITLTNLSKEEFERILVLRVSPLYISVHAWDAQRRSRMMGNCAAARLPDQLNRLAQAGIQIHAQIVLVPGYNDGEILHQTVHQLAALYPHVLTVGIVPVGLTRFRHRLPLLRVLTPEECARILDEGARWQSDFRDRYGKAIVYFADEFYVSCGHDIPQAEDYDGFELLENGIGMQRVFWQELCDLLDEVNDARDGLAVSLPPSPRHLITGVLGAPFLRKCLGLINERIPARLSAEKLHVHTVRNDFFGQHITVSGLITATDIADQVGDLGGEEFVIPRVMLKSDEDVFLDGHSVMWLEERLKGRAKIVDSGARGFLEAIGFDESSPDALK